MRTQVGDWIRPCTNRRGRVYTPHLARKRRVVVMDGKGNAVVETPWGWCVIESWVRCDDIGRARRRAP